MEIKRRRKSKMIGQAVFLLENGILAV